MLKVFNVYFSLLIFMKAKHFLLSFLSLQDFWSCSQPGDLGVTH
jgi:hypothetical protein